MFTAASLITLYIFLVFLAMQKIIYSSCYKLPDSAYKLPTRDYIFIALILILACAFRSERIADTTPYMEAFYEGNSRMEFMWEFLRMLTFWTKTHVSIFFIYSLITTFVVLRFILKYSPFPIFSILIWISYIYIIQDMIQMRQGVASAIFLLSIPYIQQKKWKKFLFLNIIGAFFHISALAVIPLYFINTTRLQKKLFISLIFISYILFFSKLGLVYLIQYIPIDFIQSLWLTKSTMLDVTSGVNMFNIRQIILVIICVCLWLNISCISDKNKNVILYIKIFTIAISTFILLFDVPDIASRINVIYSVSEIIAIPSLIYIYRRKIYGKILVLGISIVFFFTYYSRFILV